MILDDFPVPVEPMIQGIDKAVRDRFDVHTFGLSEFQPKWTMRKFGYLLELKVGKGRLLMTGFNFSGIGHNDPATCAMFESMIRYIRSEAFKPQTAVSPEQFERFLLEKGAEPIMKERKMTQFWQLDEEPLESAAYWQQAENYIANGS
jgi:hypothetical protein